MSSHHGAWASIDVHPDLDAGRFRGGRLGASAGALALGLLSLGAGVSAQSTADVIGLTALRQRLGPAVPTGAGVPLMQVEGLTGPNAYMPDWTSPDLSGKTINDRSGGAGAVSAHSTNVARIGFGVQIGVAPGVPRIDVFKIDFSITPSEWLVDAYLGFGGGLPVVADDLRVQNHSWAAGVTFDPYTVEVVRRLDYAVRRDDVVACVGVANTTGSMVPPMLGSCYNVIAVGNSSGTSSHGPTGGDVAGRSKPDIVGPYLVSSYSTPVVSGCVALLLEAADGLGNPRRSRLETIKAALLSGATKDAFAGLPVPWNRVDNGAFREPLDRRFGAGLVNVDLSHRILGEGEKDGTDLALDGEIGWDHETLTGVGDVRRYYFQAGLQPSTLSATVTWLRRIAPTGPGPNLFASSDATLATIELRLHEVDDALNLVGLVDGSLSPVDNVQHLFRRLVPGRRYALEVLLGALPPGQTSEDFAVAWLTLDRPKKAVRKGL